MSFFAIFNNEKDNYDISNKCIIIQDVRYQPHLSLASRAD